MNEKTNFRKPRLTVKNEQFSDLSDRNNLAKYIEWDALPGISFVNCSFENIHLLGKVLGSCSFQNCRFNNVNLRKATISGSQFKNCQIMNSDMTRAEFYGSSFTNCNFLKVDLRASDFCRCKFQKTTFFESNLDLIGISDVKVWKSDEWIEIKDFSSFD